MKLNVEEYFKIVPKEILSRTYIVGGFVRDLLNNDKPNDIDFVVENCSHSEMISLGFKQVGADFPVYLDKENNEFALCRTERKSGKGYLGFESNINNVSIEEDLKRRDLTINAMAIDSKGNLIDPYNGYKDLKNKVLKHVSEAFSEDPVRVLRLARFKTKYKDFFIDIETKKLVFSLKKELSTLVPERIFKEIEKILTLKNPSTFFYTLLELKVLKEIFPELFEMISYDHNAKYHAEGNVLNHSLFVLDKASELTTSTNVKFAALFHDIGKPRVYKKYFKYYGHSNEDLVKELSSLLKKRLKFNNKIERLLNMGAIYHHKLHDLEKLTIKRILKMIFENNFPKNEEELEDLIVIVNADSLGRITCNDNNATILDSNELELVLKYGSYKINGLTYSVGEKTLNEDYLRALFKIKRLKINVEKFINDYENKFKIKPSTDKIKEFVYNERLKILKRISHEFKNKKES